MSAEVVAREKTEMLNKALGEQLVSLKLELLNIKGE
ncbi:XkdW family protein [Bacillus velezensis]